MIKKEDIKKISVELLLSKETLTDEEISIYPFILEAIDEAKSKIKKEGRKISSIGPHKIKIGINTEKINL